MKRILLIDSIREIKSTFSRFMAIVAIVALSVTFFTGIRMSCPDMQFTADTYFDEQNLMDFRLISTVGFSRSDIERLKEVEEVNGIMPSYTVDVMAKYKDVERVVRVHSIKNVNERIGSNYMNVPMLLTGRLPESMGECIVEEGFLKDIKIGQKFTIDAGIENKELTTIRKKEYTVVGIVRSPLYISKERGNSTIGNGKVSSFMYINEEDFDLPVYNEIYMTINGASNMDTYSDEYKNLIESVKVKIEALSDDIVKERYDDILSNATTTYNEGVGSYNFSTKSSSNQMQEAEDSYKQAVLELDKSTIELQNKKGELDRQEQIFKSELSSNKQYLQELLNDIMRQLTNVDSSLSLAKISNSEDLISQLEGNYESLFDAKLEIEKSIEDLGKKEIEAKLAIDTGRLEIIQGENRIAEARQSLVGVKSSIEENRKTINASLYDANKDLTDALEEIRGIDEVKWYVLGRDTNVGFVDYENASNTMNAISKVFPILFVFVAILICLTTMGRLVDEQRGYIGTLKALGYSSFDIASKYLIYSSSASILGCIIGIAIGFTFMPSLVFEAYGSLYNMPDLIRLFDKGLALLCILISVGLTSFAAIYVCRGELTSNAAKLLRPKAPKSGTKIFLERIEIIWSRLKFTQKVTARNLFRYKSRFFMTVIGISGCTALLVVGLGIRDSVIFIGENQFTNIFKYDMAISLKEELEESNYDEIIKDIKNLASIKNHGEFMRLSVTGEGDMNKDAALIIPKDEKNIKSFINLRDRTTGKEIVLGNDGVVLSEKLAKLLGAEVGETIFVKVDDYNGYNVNVAAITENYMEHYIYIKESLFEEIFIDEEVSWNVVYANLITSNEALSDKVATILLEEDNITGVVKSYNSRDNFGDMVNSIDFIVMILIISAGLLSFVVLYTLTNINVSERMREIATIKVLGFYDRETAAYVFRENIILAMIGGALGLVIGYVLCMYIIVTVEVEILMFGRDIRMSSYMISFILTMLFTIIVNWIMLRKIKAINMVEALKTVE